MSSHKDSAQDVPPIPIQRDGVEVLFTPSILKRFKQTHDDAVESGTDLFIFDGNEYVPGYTKYLIEYLENEFRRVTS